VKADYIFCKFRFSLPRERDLNNNARRRLREKIKKKLKKQKEGKKKSAFGIVSV